MTLGVGDPAVCVAWFPHCGCDACDSGSRHELDELDAHMLSIVSGAYRRLSAGDRVVTVMHDGRWSASGLLDEQSVSGVLADPSGWTRSLAAPGFGHIEAIVAQRLTWNAGCKLGIPAERRWGQP